VNHLQTPTLFKKAFDRHALKEIMSKVHPLQRYQPHKGIPIQVGQLIAVCIQHQQMGKGP
jgi:hypothetical protein